MHEGERHMLCPSCNYQRRHPPTSVAAGSAISSVGGPSSSSPSLLFDRDPSSIIPLTIEQRFAVITLHKAGIEKSVIATRIPWTNMGPTPYWSSI